MSLSLPAASIKASIATQPASASVTRVAMQAAPASSSSRMMRVMPRPSADLLRCPGSRLGEEAPQASRRHAISAHSLGLDLDTGFAKVVVGQQLTPTDAVVSITRDGSGRRDQAALASRTLGGRAM